MNVWVQMRGLVRIVLGPVLLWQGRRVRRNVLRLPEASGPREGMIGQGAPLRLMIVGDSSAAGVGAETQSEALAGHLTARLATSWEVTWRLIAKTGWTTAEACAALPPPDGARFEIVILCLGVNDVTTETGHDEQRTAYGDLIDRLKKDYGVTSFVASGLPPMGRFPALPQPLRWYLGLQSQALDQALGAFAAARNYVTHMPLHLDLDVDAMAEDGFHPGPEVYAAWADQLVACIRELELPASSEAAA